MPQQDARRALLINNPVSGRPGPHRLVTQVAARLRQFGWSVDVELTDHPGHATTLAAAAVRADLDLVVACGGDGTINETIQPLIGSQTALGVIPVGTMNVWAGEIGLPTDRDALAEQFDHGPRRRIDVGEASSRYFLLMASLGFDAAVVGAVSPRMKRRFGRLAYAMAAVDQLRSFSGTQVEIELDGVTEQHTILMAIAGNTRRYAGYFSLTHKALIDDGMLDLCLVPGEAIAGSLPQIGAVLSGIAPLRRTLLYRRARTISITAARPLSVQIDGDYAGTTPLRLACVPSALTVVMPERTRGKLFSANT